MKTSHMSMRNLPTNRMPPQLLDFLLHQESREATALKRTKSLTMDVRPNGSQLSAKGPAEYFTGTVRIDPLFEAPDPARAHVARASRWTPAANKALVNLISAIA